MVFFAGFLPAMLYVNACECVCVFELWRTLGRIRGQIKKNFVQISCFFLLSYLFFEKKQNIHAHISYTNESIDAKFGLDGHTYIHQYVNKLSDRLLLLLILWNTMASNSAK